MRRTSSVAAPIAHLVGPGKLKVINGHLAFTGHEQGPIRLDPRILRTLLCYGPVGITDQAFQTLFEHDIQVAWLSPAGNRCRGRLVRSNPPTTNIRLLQCDAFRDPALQREWACRIVAAKIETQIQAARHYQRHGSPGARPVLQQLQQSLRQCQTSPTLERLRGIEGAASAAWFALFGQLLNSPWQFTQRVRRPPTDPVNALLSLGYTWVLTRLIARCEAAGLEIYVGALHEYRPGRPSLACDLIEPFRVPAVDRWVISLCNQNKITPEDFRPENGGIRLQPAAFGPILRDWEDHWISGGQEEAIEQSIACLLDQLRQWAALSSAPLVTPDEHAL